MLWTAKLKKSLMSNRLRTSVTVALILFSLSVVCDRIMMWRGVQAANTYFNDLVLGVTGGVCAGLILSFQASRDAMESARERMLWNAELNQPLRSAVLHMANSALLPDEMDRLRVMDEAVQQIDEVLTGLVPAAGSKALNN